MRCSLSKYNKFVDYGETGTYSGSASSECKVYRVIDGVKTLVTTISRAEEYEYIKQRDDFEAFSLPGSPIKIPKKKTK